MDVTILQTLKDYIGIDGSQYDLLIILFILFLCGLVFFSITNFFGYIAKYGVRR